MNCFAVIGAMAFALGIRAGPVPYTLHGKVEGLDQGWIILYHPGDGPGDTAMISHGEFDFTGSVAEPEFCHLVFHLGVDKVYSMAFFLQGGTLGLTGKKDSIGQLVPSGAPIQEEYLGFERQEAALAYWPSRESAFEAAEAAKNKAAIDSLQRRGGEIVRRQAQLAKDYAAAHPSSYVAVWEVRNYFSYDPDADVLQGIYNGFAQEIKDSRQGKLLKNTLDAAFRTGIGRPAPAFVQADTKGKPVALSVFKGQYVLVDFWASWCGPCREENPNVLKNYRQYHSRGFTVLSVSLDDKKDEWLKAVRKDRLPWTQVCDLKGWKNDAAVLYGVEGIPMNYLLDKEGKIVARELRDEELGKKLEELLH